MKIRHTEDGPILVCDSPLLCSVLLLAWRFNGKGKVAW